MTISRSLSIDGRALVVDDEPLVRELLCRRLSEAGFVTRASGLADEAVALATEADEPLDVILVNDRLPDGSAMDLIRRLRSDPRTATTSIAVMTVDRDPAHTLHMLESGADDCLRKPIDRVELVARVRSLYRIKRQLDELRRANARLFEMNAELERSAHTDALTHLANRRELETRLAGEVERAQRYGEALSLLVLDIDFFKRVNDQYGHAAGDEVLRRVAGIVGGAVRRVDLAARYGGEELVVIAPSTGAEGAGVFAERLRRVVEETEIDVPSESGASTAVRVTVSIGVATLSDEKDADALFATADAALYRAKRGGRNRVVHHVRAESLAQTAPKLAQASKT